MSNNTQPRDGTDEAAAGPGRAWIEPRSAVVAGSLGSWRLTYEAGTAGLPAGARIRIHTDSDTDWGLPQLSDPHGPDYLSYDCPVGTTAALIVRDVKSLLIHILGNGLKPGQKISVTLGDMRRGSPGSRAQTFAEEHRYFWFAVDRSGTGQYAVVDDSPVLRVIAGEAVRLVALAPSVVSEGDAFSLLVKAEDEWGNPCGDYRGTIRLEAPGVSFPSDTYTFEAGNGGCHRFENCACPSAGTHAISVRDAAHDFLAHSNAIRCARGRPALNIFWGDPHGGQLVLARKIESFFTFARDAAGLDFAGYQRNDNELTDDDWRIQQLAETAFHEPGRFVPLPGFEWSGVPGQGGHHNVYLGGYGRAIRRSGRSGLVDRTDTDADLPHICEVYEAFRDTDVVITPHVGGGLADLNFHEPALEPALEVTSTHGSFEWFFMDALSRGYRIGAVGGSDGYTGRPGAEYPGHLERRYAKGGLAAVLATELTLPSLLEALKQRHCYATTGSRILLDFRCGERIMGDELVCRTAPAFEAYVAGTAALESVELYRGRDLVCRHPLPLAHAPKKIRLLWHGASREDTYSGVIWDGKLKINGGKLISATTVRFDSPRSHTKAVSESGLAWHAVTCGYAGGLILECDGSDDTTFDITLESSLITRPLYNGNGAEAAVRKTSYAPAESIHCRCRWKEFRDEALAIDIGTLGRKLTLAQAPSDSNPATAAMELADDDPRPGPSAYWLKVVQSDMEMAWSSPIFVEYSGRKG